MPDSEEHVALERLVEAAPTRYAIVLLVGEDGSVASVSKNLSPENTMMVCFSLAQQIAQEIKAEHNLPDVPTNNHKPAIYLPPDLQRKLREL